MSAEELVPYIEEPHPVTGITNGKLAMWLFLASEVMLFGALFSSFILLRVGGDPVVWNESPKKLSVGIGALNTLILIGSSVTMVLAWASLKMNDFKKSQIYLGLTLGLSLLFLFIKILFEYMPKLAHHDLPSTNTFFAVYFTMTGLHGLHVLIGAAVIGYWLATGATYWESKPGLYTNRIEYTGLYWHFVDLVWIFLFPSLYLLKDLS